MNMALFVQWARYPWTGAGWLAEQKTEDPFGAT